MSNQNLFLKWILTIGIDEENKTMVVIPCILSDAKKVRELANKIEVYYLANKSENIFFTILGDPFSSTKEIEEKDEEIKKCGIYEINKLNQKYPKEGISRFNFIYRKRIWNEKENCFLGWERKRGLLTELNEYLIEEKKSALQEKNRLKINKKMNSFIINTIEEEKIKNPNEKLDIKYIITLDSDTNLTLNSGIELIEAMAHPLNKPEIDEEKNIVKEGYGLIQPRIGIDLDISYQSDFTEIFAGDRRS